MRTGEVLINLIQQANRLLPMISLHSQLPTLMHESNQIVQDDTHIRDEQYQLVTPLFPV